MTRAPHPHHEVAANSSEVCTELGDALQQKLGPKGTSPAVARAVNVIAEGNRVEAVEREHLRRAVKQIPGVEPHLIS